MFSLVSKRGYPKYSRGARHRGIIWRLTFALAVLIYSTNASADQSGSSPFPWPLIIAILLKIASVLGLILLLFSVLIMLLTFRKAKKVSPLGLIISMFFSLLSLIIYTELLHVRLSFLWWIAGLGAGGLIGIGWSLTSRLFVEQGLVKTQGNIGYLIVWGLVFGLNQLITIITGRPIQIAMLLLLSSTGLVLGNSSTILARFYHLRMRIAEEKI
ncbi:MAG: hypothetical protein C0407_12055 [Desulfobacca sp.]|nr:hypothetical protein [Desulfobacca sp.]